MTERDDQTYLPLSDPFKYVVIGCVALYPEVLCQINTCSYLPSISVFPFAFEIVRSRCEIQGDLFKMIDVGAYLCISPFENKFSFARDQHLVALKAIKACSPKRAGFTAYG